MGLDIVKLRHNNDICLCFIPLAEGSLSNSLNEKNSFQRAHNTRGRQSSLTIDTVRKRLDFTKQTFGPIVFCCKGVLNT